MFDKFLNQLRDNPRLRWGVALMVGIFWLYGILLLRETLQEENLQYRTAAQSISRLRAQLAQPEWTARLVPAKVMAVQLESRLWQAPTSGLAQAAFQDWLNAAMVNAKVNAKDKTSAVPPQITVTVIDEAVASTPNQQQDSSTTTPAGLWKIKAKLGVDFSAAALMAFLNQVENNEKQIIVGALNVRREPAPYVDMELYAYFQKQPGPAIKPMDKLAPVKLGTQ